MIRFSNMAVLLAGAGFIVAGPAVVVVAVAGAAGCGRGVCLVRAAECAVVDGCRLEGALPMRRKRVYDVAWIGVYVTVVVFYGPDSISAARK